MLTSLRNLFNVYYIVKKASSYIVQYPVLRTVQSTLHFTSLTDLFIQTPSHLISYSFIQLSELEQCRVKNLAQGFNIAAQDSNPGSISRDSEAQPLTHWALLYRDVITEFTHTNLIKIALK